LSLRERLLQRDHNHESNTVVAIRRDRCLRLRCACSGKGPAFEELVLRFNETEDFRPDGAAPSKAGTGRPPG
jgi:hypothetical protein